MSYCNEFKFYEYNIGLVTLISDNMDRRRQSCHLAYWEQWSQCKIVAARESLVKHGG
jgi:hypothetical protein